MALALLDAALLAAFGLGFVAAYLHPQHLWWTELIAVGLPYLAMLVVLATVVVAAQRRWALLAVHGVVLALALFRFAPLGRLGPLPEPSESDLTLLTFNLVERWGPAEGRQERVAAYVRAVDADLVALQEVNTVYGPRSARGRLASHVELLRDTLGYRTARLEGLGKRLMVQDPVLGRIPLGEQTIIELPNPSGDPHSAQLVRVRFRWQGREAVLYNVHLRSFGEDKLWDEEGLHLLNPGLWRGYLRQYRKAYLLRAVEVEAIADVLEEETLPFILCGDFNSVPHNWAYRHLAAELGLQDAFEVAGRGWGATYHTRYPFARIDFVLTSPEWEIVSARVGDVSLSDHRPLVVRLRWSSGHDG